MVRRARFSWDETDGFQPPLERDEFDDLDDFCDPPFPDNPRRREPQRRKRRRNSEPQEPRHLAGADWVNEPPHRDD